MFFQLKSAAIPQDSHGEFLFHLPPHAGEMLVKKSNTYTNKATSYTGDESYLVK